MRSPASYTEKELVSRLIAGDAEAFDALYRQYFHPVYCNALKITREVPAAEDVLQEVFIILWEKRQSLDPGQSVGGWLFVLCYNKSVNVLRRQLRTSLLKENLHQQAEIPAEEDRFTEQWQTLEDAMSCLSPQRRRVFELCKLQGKTYEEAALELHISKYTVKEYLSAAVAAVKEYAHLHPGSSVAIVTLFLVH